MPQRPPETQALLDYIEGSPSPYHCVEVTRGILEARGYTELAEQDPWDLTPGDQHFVARDGTLVAFRVGARPPSEAGFRVIGAHTDSPNLRIKPNPDVTKAGFRQLGVELYGGVLTYTWLDRDLGLAGRVFVQGQGASDVTTRLLDIRAPILRIPSLAIHLNRSVRSDGLKLNNQKHLAPVLGLAGAEDDPEGALRTLVGDTLDVAPDAILGWDLMLFDVVPPTFGGLDDAFIFAPRLDNQACCHAALAALVAASERDLPAATAVICLYDHEECGSGSSVGAEGPFADWILRRLALVGSEDTETVAFARAAAASFQISADMAHAVHPNYEDRHEPQHQPALNGGPVIKVNSNQRYATSGEGAARFEAICRAVDIPCQRFVTRSDLACGTTIGPISAARLGIRTVDVGNPMWSMHSIREQAGAHDHPQMIAAMTYHLSEP